MFQTNMFQHLNTGHNNKRKYLLEQGIHLTLARNDLVFEVGKIESMQDLLKQYEDPIKALDSVLEEIKVRELQTASLDTKIYKLKDELAFLEQKKKEHYEPEQERSVLNRV